MVQGFSHVVVDVEEKVGLDFASILNFPLVKTSVLVLSRNFKKGYRQVLLSCKIFFFFSSPGSRLAYSTE
jgi:hypothetical protein